MAELKPCPFCGGEAELKHNEIIIQTFSYVVCRNCGAKTGEYRVNSTYSSDEKAIEAWNMRGGEDEIIENAETIEERKTGRWKFQAIIHGKRMWCSNCHSAFDLCCNQIKRYDEATKNDELWAYCPWCGAKMEVEHE